MYVCVSICVIMLFKNIEVRIRKQLKMFKVVATEIIIRDG